MISDCFESCFRSLSSWLYIQGQKTKNAKALWVFLKVAVEILKAVAFEAYGAAATRSLNCSPWLCGLRRKRRRKQPGSQLFSSFFLLSKLQFYSVVFIAFPSKSWYLLLWGVEKRVSIVVQKSIVFWPIVYWLQGFRRQHVMISFQTSVLFLWRHPYNPHYSHLSSTLEIPWWLKLKNMFLVLEDIKIGNDRYESSGFMLCEKRLS